MHCSWYLSVQQTLQVTKNSESFRIEGEHVPRNNVYKSMDTWFLEAVTVLYSHEPQ